MRAARRRASSDAPPRWTPSAPTASATSIRSLTYSATPGRRGDRAQRARQLGQRAAGEILLAELHGDAVAAARPLAATPRRAAATTSASGRPPSRAGR